MISINYALDLLRILRKEKNNRAFGGALPGRRHLQGNHHGRQPQIVAGHGLQGGHGLVISGHVQTRQSLVKVH